MKFKKIVICFCILLVLFITSCKKEDENINKDFTFENASYVYDGKVYSLALKGELSDGYSIAYTNNEHSEIGKHEVMATVSNDKTKKEILEIIKHILRWLHAEIKIFVVILMNVQEY